MGGLKLTSDPQIWAKISAIAQVLAALATFLAAYIALAIARSERKMQVRVKAWNGCIVSTSGSTDVISVTVENIGLRVAKIDGIGWMGGFPVWALPRIIRWMVPTSLRQRTLFQIPDYEWHINQNFPWRLEPGESKSTHFRETSFFEEFSDKQGETFFRRLPLAKKLIAVIPRVFVSVDTQPITRGEIAPKLIAKMKQAYLAKKKESV